MAQWRIVKRTRADGTESLGIERKGERGNWVALQTVSDNHHKGSENGTRAF